MTPPRSGTIRAESRTRDLDRSDETFAVWERGTQGPIDLPWADATTLAVDRVRGLLDPARMAIVVSAGGRAGTQLISHALSTVPRATRLYVYAPRALENDAQWRNRLSSRGENVLTRLGPAPPADWLVVDDGRAGLLVVGAPGEERRWALTVEDQVARSLHDVARTLFWFHALREGMADATAAWSFRTPMPAPFADPGKDLSLSAGRFVVGRSLADAVPDAEVRVAPGGVASRGARMVFLPPTPNSFASAEAHTSAAARVVWTDLSLPPLAVSRERAVMDLADDAFGLQLELPRQVAIELNHRLSKIGSAPAWTYHQRRRLGDVAGEIILPGSPQPQAVVKHHRIPVPDLRAALETFDHAELGQLPNPPPLAVRVTYAWNVVPEARPPRARASDLVQRWQRVDEWWRRQVDASREALSAMDREEQSLLGRLGRWLRGQDDRKRQRKRLSERLVELGELAPSQQANQAKAVCKDVAAVAAEVRAIAEQGQTARQDAEEDAAREEQQATWEAQTTRARADLERKREALGALEPRHAAIATDLTSAEQALKSRLEEARAERAAALTPARDALVEELGIAERELEALKGASKDEKRGAARKVHETREKLNKANREIDGTASWGPPADQLVDERAALERSRKAREALRAEDDLLRKQIGELEKQANAEFRFQPPTRPGAGAAPAASSPPAIPDEGPPELGELYELDGARFLAVKTWDQVPRALPVAQRLAAKLVSTGDESK
jgi:hypothetical protein